MGSTTRPRTLAQLNARLSEIGAELARYRFTPHPDARALEAEEAQLRVELRLAERVEGEERAILARVEAAEQAAAAKEQQDRIEREVQARLAQRAAART